MALISIYRNTSEWLTWPELRGHMIISVNDIPQMREIFQDFTMESVNINYTVGGTTHRKPTMSGLIIRNW